MTLSALFTAILNMSITASYVALAVMFIRLCLSRAPKIFSYLLWLAVLIRLVFPFSFNSPFSLLGFLQSNVQAGTGAMEYIPSGLGLMQIPAVNVGADGINQAINSSLPPATPEASANTMQIMMEMAGIIWTVGAISLLVYGIVSYLKVIHMLRTATLLQDNVYETDRITTPFVSGFIKPKIYVPVGISDQELSYILEHERTHIRRRDYLIKPFAYLLLIVHWFNPLMWMSFKLMSKDMEMACDEAVIQKMGSKVKGNYSKSLLSFAAKRSGSIVGGPLAFGESHVHSRIRNVLNYKKPTLRVVAAACLVTLIIIIGLSANPAKEQDISAQSMNQLAADWAHALKTRDGKPRYEMMSDVMKVKFKQEQIDRGGENWNYNIGDSSPWVVDYDIAIEGRMARITYYTQTSEPASYKTEEELTFGQDEGKLVVTDYQIVYENQPD